MRSLSVVYCGEPSRFRLVTRPPNDDTTVEEVILHVQGILCEKDLPPISAAQRSVTTMQSITDIQSLLSD